MKYAKPAVLNRHAHRELLFQATDAFEFAAAMHAAPLCAAEFFAAAKEYAILFVRHAGEAAFPVIILGLKQNENWFVSPEGRWNARYLPFAVRAYPFAAIPNGGGGDMQVVIDEAYMGFDSTAGAALFGDAGDPAPELQKRLRFLQTHQHEVSQTREFSAKLERLGVLVEQSAQVTIDEQTRFHLKGFWMVDENKLHGLDDVDLLRLVREGYLSLITAHLASISNLSLLALKLNPSAANTDAHA